MRMDLSRLAALASASLIALGASGTAWAEEAGNQGGSADAPNEIIVTANKRAESLQKIAGSVSALNADQLATRAVTSITDLSRETPGVNISSTSGTTRVTIRGVGLQVITGVAEANVAQHIDGIFQSQPTMANVAPVDLQRIEVLRGPQGTLYGRNATGGTINYVIQKPTNELKAGISAGVGSFDARRVDGYLSGPIIDGVLLGRVSGYFNRDAGYYTNSFLNTKFNAHRDYGFRGALTLVPSDKVTVDVSGYYQRETGSYPPQTLIRGSNPFADFLTFLGLFAPGEAKVDLRPDYSTGGTDPYLAKWTWGATLDVQADAADWLKIRSLTGITRHSFTNYFDADGINLDMVSIGSPTNPRLQTSRAFSQEFNFSGGTADGKLKYLTGLYYFDGKLNALIPSLFGDPRVQAALGALVVAPGALFQGQTQHSIENTKSQAIFADVTYSIVPSVRLNLGGRYSSDTKESIQDLTLFLNTGNIAACSGLLTAQSFNKFNGKARLEFDIAPDVMGYAQYSTGFKDGGTNLSACGGTFLPENLTSYEAGIKSSWMNGAVTANASVFHYVYKNLQVLAFRGATDAFIDNVTRAETTGGEFDLGLHPARNLDINVSGSLLDAKIKQMSSFDSENPAAGNQNLAGLPLPNAPKFTLTAGVQYKIPAAFGSITPRVELYHSSSYNFRLFNNAIDRQDGYTMVNATLTVDVGGRYQLRGYAKNLTNRHVLNQLLFSTLSGVAGEYGRPREWGIDASVKF